jgi:hypothetical protein
MRRSALEVARPWHVNTSRILAIADPGLKHHSGIRGCWASFRSEAVRSQGRISIFVEGVLTHPARTLGPLGPCCLAIPLNWCAAGRRGAEGGPAGIPANTLDRYGKSQVPDLALGVLLVNVWAVSHIFEMPWLVQVCSHDHGSGWPRNSLCRHQKGQGGRAFHGCSRARGEMVRGLLTL